MAIKSTGRRARVSSIRTLPKALRRRTPTPSQWRVVTPEEGRALFDRQARKSLDMSGDEFIQAWNAGQFDDNPDRPEIMRLYMLLPLVGSS